MPLPTQKPTKKQLLYGKFSPDLYRLTGGEETDSLLDVIDADMSATNAGSVQTSASDIGGGGSSANTTVVANGSVEAGKTSFDNTVAGYILGVDPTNGAAKFYIGNTSSYLNWDGATLTIVGGVAISQLNIPDLVTANSFHVDSSGNAWWGATTIGSATAKVLDTGVATFSNANITGGSVATSTLNVAVMGWTTDIVFSSASATQVNWTSGHISVQSGTTYTISSGNTGTMSALTYIYLDTAVSVTVLQITTTYSTATGNGKVLIATAQNNAIAASVINFGGNQPVIDGTAQIAVASITAAAVANATLTGTQIAAATIAAGNIVSGTITATQIAANTITASQIAANTITASQIAAGTITATQMTVSTLSAISANLGSITAGTITLPTSGWIQGGQTAYNTGTGFFLGYSGGAYKFSIGVGGSSSNCLTWDGITLTLNGYAQTNQLYYTYQLNNSILQADDASTGTSSTSYVKLKEIQCGATMAATTLRIVFTLDGGTIAPAYAYGRIYKNGVAYGTEQNVQEPFQSATQFSQDLSFSAGDLIQIYAKVTGTTTSTITNFRILGTLIINQYTFTVNL
jgi:hypothetical protein